MLLSPSPLGYQRSSPGAEQPDSRGPVHIPPQTRQRAWGREGLTTPPQGDNATQQPAAHPQQKITPRHTTKTHHCGAQGQTQGTLAQHIAMCCKITHKDRAMQTHTVYRNAQSTCMLGKGFQYNVICHSATKLRPQCSYRHKHNLICWWQAKTEAE